MGLVAVPPLRGCLSAPGGGVSAPPAGAGSAPPPHTSSSSPHIAPPPPPSPWGGPALAGAHGHRHGIVGVSNAIYVLKSRVRTSVSECIHGGVGCWLHLISNTCCSFPTSSCSLSTSCLCCRAMLFRSSRRARALPTLNREAQSYLVWEEHVITVCNLPGGGRWDWAHELTLAHSHWRWNRNVDECALHLVN